MKILELTWNGRWEWVTEWAEECVDDNYNSYTETHRANHHTSPDGDGLWRNGQQVEGTCQFRLPTGDENRKRARRKIRYYHTGE